MPGYARYMDDMALWGGREELKAARVALERLLADELGLRLKANWHLQPTAHGMNFLGYRVFANGSRLARSSRRRFLRRWSGIEHGLAAGEIGEAVAQRCALALTAFVRVARRESLLARLFGKFRAPAIGLQPRQSRRQLGQHRAELPVGLSRQEFAGQAQPQPRLPSRPQLMPGLERPTD